MTTVMEPIKQPTGELEVLTRALREPTDVVDGQVITISNPKPRPSFLRRLGRFATRVWFAVRRAVATTREGVSWLFSGVIGAVRSYGRWRREVTYIGRHQAVRAWYGRERSTYERVGRRQTAAARRDAAASEGELCFIDEAFVGWVQNYLEVMREERAIMYPTRHPLVRGKHACS